MTCLVIYLEVVQKDMFHGNCYSCFKNNNGYMTVYLTLTMAVLLSLCLTLIEGVRSNAVILESEVASDISVNSIMAEYNRELMKQYNIFAIEDSYGTSNASLDNTEQHLEKYLNGNLSSDLFLGGLLNYRDFLSIDVEKADIVGVLYLTDDDGNVFMRRAYEALKDDIGLELLSELSEWTEQIESQGLEDMNLLEEMEDLNEQTKNEQMKSEQAEDDRTDSGRTDSGQINSGHTEGEIVEYTENNELGVSPADSFLSYITSGLLYCTVDNVDELSSESINPSELIFSRMKADRYNLGNLQLEDESAPEQIIERYVFQEYLLRYMGRYGYEGEDALKYQIEYIISGKSSDIDNLSDVVDRIFAIRCSEDFLCLSGDEERCSEAEIYADLISVITYTEELADVYKEMILLVWSAYEALYDVRSLLAGNRIEAIKTSENWHTLISGNTVGANNAGDEDGLTYTDYLRILMMLTSKKALVGRAMDMVEADIRLTEGNSDFRMDACIDTVCVDIGVRSSFGYSYDFMIRRRYE